MKNIKNIWSLFYPLLIFITVVFIYIIITSNKAIYDQQKELSLSYNQMLYNSLDTTLTQNEVLLDTLAQELFTFGMYKDPKRAKLLLQKALENSKYVLGFGLIDPKGNFLVTSNNIDINIIPNILINKQTRETFYEALQSDQMVVGRTYYFSPLHSWAIPLRKAIRDKNGTVIGVMTSGLVNSSKNNIFDSVQLHDKRTIVLIQDADKKHKYYNLYYNNGIDLDYNSVYQKPLPQKVYDTFIKNMVKDLKVKSVEKLKDGSIYYTSAVDRFGNDGYVALSYNKKYKIWVLVHQEKEELFEQYLYTTLSAVLVYLFIVLIFYFLFRTIAKKEQEKERELLYKASHDSLTGHYNRDFLTNDDTIIKKIKNEKFDVIFLDIDNFKNINDRFGHHVGDRVLVGVAQRLESFFNKEDIIIRHGGDEFIVLNLSSIDLEELTDVISAPCSIDDLEFRLGVSIGISKYPEDSLNLDELFSMADIAMHAAKKVKNSYKYFDTDMYERSIENSDIEQHLRHALDRKELYMVYQPQISKDMEVYGVEALIRWENDQLGTIPPDKFIAVAEDNGMIIKIGAWIIRQALSDIKEVREQTGQKFHISLNISVIQFMEVGFLEDLLEVISELEMDKTYVTLEITESLAIEEFNYVIPLLQKVREHDIDISLDDFGTGYSSLSILKKLPISELKIDKQFVDDVRKDRENSLIKTIFSIGKNFSFKIVCEGTETAEQVEVLQEYGTDVFQGYYFSKPLKKEQLIKFIKEFHD